MRLKRIEIEGYRGIKRAQMDFDPRLTVIIGRNGAGKTTILNAAKNLMATLASIWPNKEGNIAFTNTPFKANDLGAGQSDCRVRIDFDWTATAKTAHLERKFSDGNKISPTLLKLYNLTKNNNLPTSERALLVYYPQSRGFQTVSRTKDVFDSTEVQNSSINGNLAAINDLGTWWQERDTEEAVTVRDRGDQTYRDPQLQAIRSLIAEIDSFTGVSYSRTTEPKGLILAKTDGSKVSVNDLSSGERGYIILLADLARRLQVMEPKKPLKDIPGVVLIDEIELNLHPEWQSKILKTLRETFAECQFVVTTHSPPVLSAVESHQVRILSIDRNGYTEVRQPRNTRGRSVGFLLEGVFETPERDPAVARLLEQFDDAYDAGQITEAKTLLTTIERATDGDPEILPILYARLERLEAAPT